MSISPISLRHLEDQLQESLKQWESKVKDLYLLKSANDPLAYDPLGSSVSSLEVEVFVKSRSIFTRHGIDPQTLRKSSSATPNASGSLLCRQTQQDPFAQAAGINPSKTQIFLQPPDLASAGNMDVHHQQHKVPVSKFTNMDLYQFYLECKQLPTCQLLQSAQKVVLTSHWTASRNELKACRIIQRLEFLKEGNAYSQRTLLPASNAPCLPKRHRSFLLDEVKWLASDFWEESQQKKRIASILANEAVAWVQEKEGIAKRKLALGSPGSKRPKLVCEFLHCSNGEQVSVFGPPSSSSIPLSCSPLSVHYPLFPDDPCKSQPLQICIDRGIESSIGKAQALSPESHFLRQAPALYARNWQLISKLFNAKFPNVIPLSASKCEELCTSPEISDTILPKSHSSSFDKYLQIFDTIAAFHPAINKPAPIVNSHQHQHQYQQHARHVQVQKRHPSTLANPHPSHDASLKQHFVALEPLSALELSARRAQIQQQMMHQAVNGGEKRSGPHQSTPSLFSSQ